jgi:predicted ATP-dependent protease
MQLVDYRFGRPSRITAVTHIGSAGFVSVEREVDLGGPIHNKGSMIVAGYLGAKFAQDVPLALSASVTFEQSYGGVEGDSASAAEIFAILSSLSEYPIRQDLSVTGSVNQHGEIQAIGGVNEKVEGVYEVCKAQGITGKQGVIIPESNVQNLMLKDEVIEAIQKGKFHIYSISTIDEGIEILTGKPAGKKDAKGRYPKNRVNHAAQEKYAEKIKEFGNGKKKKK